MHDREKDGLVEILQDAVVGGVAGGEGETEFFGPVAGKADRLLRVDGLAGAGALKLGVAGQKVCFGGHGYRLLFWG